MKRIFRTKSSFAPMISPAVRSLSRILIVCPLLLLACQDSDYSSKAEQSEIKESPLPKFSDATSSAGLAEFRHNNGANGKVYFPELMGSGGGFVDYDGDDWLDILLVGGGEIVSEPSNSTEALRLYKNNRDGSFSEVTREAGLAGIQTYGQGITAADFDNDGDEDFYFTTLNRNHLFRNDGAKFVDVSDQAFVSNPSEWSSSAMFFDADLDGDLDLFVANYVDWSPNTDIFCSIQGIIIGDTGGATDLEEKYGQKVYCPPFEFDGLASRFYRNDGKGAFADETEKSGFHTDAGKSLGVAEFDFNGDGWPDIVVTNDAEADFLYKNNGDGSFSEIGESSGIAFDDIGRTRAGMGIDIGVVDDSGQESIFIGNFSSEMIGVYKQSQGDQFLDRSSASKIGQPSFLTLTFGLFLFDAEYDGDLDLLAANGHVWAIRPSLDGSKYRQPAQLFLNQGKGQFSQAGSTSGDVLNKEMVARGASYGDYDRDGDIDVLIMENGGPAHLWKNELEDANYLRVGLQGTTSNSEGLGSEVIAVVDGNRFYRRIRTGSSYLSQSEKIASFGLGVHEGVDSLLVKWPSGRNDVFTDIEGGQEIIVTEGDSKTKTIVSHGIRGSDLDQ